MNRCAPCSPGTYSLQDPFEAQTCNLCLPHAVCLGGKNLYPDPGYWRMDMYSENIIQCENTQACL